MKIVINSSYGGFSISLEAAKFMSSRGNARATKEIQEYENHDKKDGFMMDRWFGFGYVEGMDGRYDRTDPDLVAAVEHLGDLANGQCATLKVIEIPDGIEWEIDNYDGLESIHETHRSWG